MRIDITIIVVLYYPKSCQVERLRDLSNHYQGVVVDNSPNRLVDSPTIGNFQYVYLNGNKGIAEAQNIAIRKILENKGIKYIVFLDQDSNVSTDYPLHIVDEYSELRKKYPNLATLGPWIYHEDGGKEYGSSIHKEKYLSDNLIVRDKIISSGSCVAVEVLNDVGLFDSNLFIDFVDSEWCWRTSSKGYLCGMTTNIKMNHRIGIMTISMGLMRDNVSAPFRYFYQYRNYVWLLKRNYVPRKWKVNNAIKNIVRIFYYPLFVKKGTACTYYMVKGLINGIKTYYKE